MIKRVALLLTLCVLPSASALAQSFVARADSDHVVAGRSFILQLTLSGTKAISDPDVVALKQAFTIVSETQSSNTTIVNGAASSSVGWRLVLIPRREGRLTVPSVSVETSAGSLRTAPSTFEVDPQAAPASSHTASDGGMVSINAKASTTTPYQNQSIRYDVRCVVRGNISDVSLGDIAMNNAIVEQEGEPDVYNEVDNGVAVRVIEFHYIITPLQAGKVMIQPVTLKGKIEGPDPAPMNDPFGGEFSNALRQALNYLATFGGEPFSVTSNQTVLDVKPPAAAMDPWLPLASLKIIEDIDMSRSVLVGEPLNRKLTLLAEGAVGNQLPDLEAKQDRANFKVYADKPTTGEDIDVKSGGIQGWRKESYSLIALKPGRLVLPAIHVRWWDLVNNKAAVAELPERVINILPAVVAQKSPAISTIARPQSMKGGLSAPPDVSMRRPLYLRTGTEISYLLIGTLTVGLLFVAYWGLKLWRKINSRTADAPSLSSEKIAVTTRTLKSIQTAAELKGLLLDYAHANWGVSRNASLEMAFSALPGSKQEFGDVEALIRGIEAALYAGEAADVEDLKNRSLRIIAASRREAGVRRKQLQKLACLNPS